MPEISSQRTLLSSWDDADHFCGRLPRQIHSSNSGSLQSSIDPPRSMKKAKRAGAGVLHLSSPFSFLPHPVSFVATTEWLSLVHSRSLSPVLRRPWTASALQQAQRFGEF